MVENILKQFLKPFKGQLLVLGFSGGADSMALFKALVKLNHPFVAAHVDHGWREESKKEALGLSDWSRKEGVPFYLKTLKLEEFKGNLEVFGRKERLKFFNEVAKKTKASSVVLGHHADDLAETTLKKLFEGAPLQSLSSMKGVGNIEGLILLRPFLSLKKQQLLDYLGETPYIKDATNFSPRFLRGRMRSDLMPYLTNSFGKEVSTSLLELSQSSSELKDYLDAAIKTYPLEKGPFGAYCDLSDSPHPFLLKAVIQEYLKVCSIGMYREEVKGLADALLSKKGNYCRKMNHRRVIADRGILFLMAKTPPLISEWKFEITDKTEITGWKSLWKGRGIGVLPSKESILSLNDGGFGTWWSKNKTPAFLRKIAPIVIDENEAPFEFLTGRLKHEYPKGMKIEIRHCAS